MYYFLLQYTHKTILLKLNTFAILTAEENYSWAVFYTTIVFGMRQTYQKIVCGTSSNINEQLSTQAVK